MKTRKRYMENFLVKCESRDNHVFVGSHACNCCEHYYGKSNDSLSVLCDAPKTRMEIINELKRAISEAKLGHTNSVDFFNEIEDIVSEC